MPSGKKRKRKKIATHKRKNAYVKTATRKRNGKSRMRVWKFWIKADNGYEF